MCSSFLTMMSRLATSMTGNGGARVGCLPCYNSLIDDHAGLVHQLHFEPKNMSVALMHDGIHTPPLMLYAVAHTEWLIEDLVSFQ